MAGRLRGERRPRQGGLHHLPLADVIHDRVRPRLDPHRVVLVVHQVHGNPSDSEFEKGAVPVMSVEDDIVFPVRKDGLPYEAVLLDGLPCLLHKLGKERFVRLEEARPEEGEGHIQAPTSSARQGRGLAPPKKGVVRARHASRSTYTPAVVQGPMPLYTGRGDAGETDLLGDRVPKSHHRIEALGSLDELNAALGVALAVMSEGPDAGLLDRVQNDLFTVGAELAMAPGQSRGLAPPLGHERVRELEEGIARLEVDLDPQKAFVLPGGSQAAAYLHYARAVVRRAERRVVVLDSKERVNPETLRYLNRLSTLLHAMALRANQAAQIEERHPNY